MSQSVDKIRNAHLLGRRLTGSLALLESRSLPAIQSLHTRHTPRAARDLASKIIRVCSRQPGSSLSATAAFPSPTLSSLLYYTYTDTGQTQANVVPPFFSQIISCSSSYCFSGFSGSIAARNSQTLFRFRRHTHSLRNSEKSEGLASPESRKILQNWETGSKRSLS